MALRIELRASLEGIDALAWDALAGPNDPFVEHAFLRGLETTGCVDREAGWLPLHVTAWDEERLVGALPLYAKDNSWGEFIFDFAWARAAAQSGVPYYPKLVSMAPFTPATGKRLLLAPDVDEELVVRGLIAGARAAADEVGASSIHLLFLTQAERRQVSALGLRPRLSLQFHWDNDGYSSFDDYLSRFRSRKRKQVVTERRRVAESGLEVRLIRGRELSDVEHAAVKRFYRDNCFAHGNHGYLTDAFFDHVREARDDRLLVCMAFDRGAPCAASINFVKGAHLYGRYWGCGANHELLHFELCYYRLIEHAIEESLTHFEAGAQGFHKLQRGLLPTEVHSAHWIRDPRLAGAIDSYLPREAFDVKAEIAALSTRSPFRRG